MSDVLKIETLKDNNRMSTQELLQLISSKISEGYTDFEINACGQHNIGGSSWAKDRSRFLNFKIKNPGQRVGAMALKGTNILVEGSAPADVGWLNSGADIVVKGDCGDTAAHCAAGGKIYVDGCVGARSGALMKHDPKFEIPEFWVLKNTGSFAFEFMGGGIAVVCGVDCNDLESVLGAHSCVGMVGGVVYVRGKINGVSDCVDIKDLDENDCDFLFKGLSVFLEKIDKTYLFEQLSDFSQWRKIIPLPIEIKEKKISVAEYRQNNWIQDGIFGDFIQDDFAVYEIPASGEGRINIPYWSKETCVDCKVCLNNCPQNAIKEDNKLYFSDMNKCIGCGICAAVCPRKCWVMKPNRREIS